MYDVLLCRLFRLLRETTAAGNGKMPQLQKKERHTCGSQWLLLRRYGRKTYVQRCGGKESLGVLLPERDFAAYVC